MRQLGLTSSALQKPPLLIANPAAAATTRAQAQILQKVAEHQCGKDSMPSCFHSNRRRQEPCLGHIKLQACLFKPLFEHLIASLATCAGIVPNKVHTDVVDPDIDRGLWMPFNTNGPMTGAKTSLATRGAAGQPASVPRPQCHRGPV